MFTEKEINLCKQVAEKYRKEVSKGDWWHRNEGNYPAEIVLVQGEGSADIFNDINKHARLHPHGFPLWTISDCLEFLRERRWTNYQFSFDKKGKTEVHIVQTPFNFRSNQEIIEEGTFLEVLLKAVLAVLEEE